jgi:hypothetical protein
MFIAMRLVNAEGVRKFQPWAAPRGKGVYQIIRTLKEFAY